MKAPGATGTWEEHLSTAGLEEGFREMTFEECIGVSEAYKESVKWTFVMWLPNV